MKPGLCVLMLIVSLAACSGPGAPGATDPAAVHQLARTVLTAWAKAVATAGGGPRVVPVGDLTGQIGDWEPDVGDNNKRALMAGLVLTDTGLSDAAPADAVVAWPDGTTTTVRLLSAQDALVAIGTTSGPCVGCVALMVMEPRLTSGPIETTRGPAAAPVWEFGVRGTAVRLTRIAIANPVVVSPVQADPQLGLRIDTASATVGGRELTVAFVGAPDPGDKPCGEDYTAEAVESELAVVVIVTRHPHFAPFGGACAAVGARRTATAALAAPLGDRVVLDLLDGTPVTVVLAQ